MLKKETISILKTYKDKNAEKYGIILLGLFGSVVRDEIKETSDIDIIVKLQKQDLFDLIGIKQDLESILGSSVDVISYRDKMNSFLKNRIDKEAIYVW